MYAVMRVANNSMYCVSVCVAGATVQRQLEGSARV
jgi:hypothetical protein